MRSSSFKVIIINQQKNKKWLNKLVYIIKKESSKNIIKIVKKINYKNVFKKCDLLISFHNGQIIKENVINYLKGNCINFHNSHLPKNKGWAPILWTAYNNDKFASTIHKISKGLDTGDICAQKIIKDFPKNCDLEKMYTILENEGIILFKSLFPLLKREIVNNLKIIDYKKQVSDLGSYQNEKQTKKIMKRLPKKYKTKISDIIKLGKNDRKNSI